MFVKRFLYIGAALYSRGVMRGNSLVEPNRLQVVRFAGRAFGSARGRAKGRGYESFFESVLLGRRRCRRSSSDCGSAGGDGAPVRHSNSALLLDSAIGWLRGGPGGARSKRR